MMPRNPRIEVEGGLYHVLTRGNNRRLIFNDDEDYGKMIALIAKTKVKLPFYLYTYCLMPNHLHLLMERRQDPISRIMQMLLAGYSRYYNRRNRRVGHLFQGRYRSILCQSDRYLAELVRYIHLNPVRANLVRDPSAFRYSSHRAYLGEEESGFLDVEPLLRHFGATKKLARKRYRAFVKAGMKLAPREDLYGGADKRVIGNEEFVENIEDRVGKVSKNKVRKIESADLQRLRQAAANATSLSPREICSRSKKRKVVLAKETLIIVGRRIGASNAELARLIGVDSSSVNRRFEAGVAKKKDCAEMQKLIEEVRKQYYKADG
jgi:putative transposase